VHHGLREHVLAREEPAAGRPRDDREEEEQRSEQTAEREGQRELAQQEDGDPGPGREREAEAGRVLQAGPPAVGTTKRIADAARARDRRDGGCGLYVVDHD